MTVEQVTNSVELKKLGYWKLYKGSQKMSQCDEEENPTGSPETALQQFRDEIATRPVGNYRVVVFRKPKGDKGGFQYEFSVPENYSQPKSTQNTMSHEDLRSQIAREIKIEQALERIEKKIDAIGEFIVSQNDGDSSNDDDFFKKMAQVFGLVNQAKSLSGSATSLTTATKAAGTNGFKSMTV